MTTRSPLSQSNNPQSTDLSGSVGTTTDSVTNTAQLDLADLTANRKLHKQRNSSGYSSEQSRVRTVDAPLDLASASISAANVPRITQKPDRRALVQARADRMHMHRAVTGDRAPTTEKPRLSSAKQNGIITNPYYRYRGGTVAKLITFFANLLKFLERFILRLLGAGKNQPAPQNKNNSSARTDKDSATKDPSVEAKLRRQQAREGRTPHRS